MKPTAGNQIVATIYTVADVFNTSFNQLIHNKQVWLDSPLH